MEHRTHEHSCGASEERNVQKSVKENKIYLHFGKKLYHSMGTYDSEKTIQPHRNRNKTGTGSPKHFEQNFSID